MYFKSQNIQVTLEVPVTLNLDFALISNLFNFVGENFNFCLGVEYCVAGLSISVLINLILLVAC